MNLSIDRGLLTHGVIAIGVCVGAWMVVVQPQVKSLHAAEAALTAGERAQHEVDEGVFEKALEKMKEVRSRVGEVQRFGSLMRDSSKLYGEIMDLAATNQVTVQNLQPGAERQSADAKTSVNRIDLTVEGPFERVASFVDAIVNLEGFIRPVSLIVVPMRDPAQPMVTAQFSCEAVNFKLPEPLAALGGPYAKP